MKVYCKDCRYIMIGKFTNKPLFCTYKKEIVTHTNKYNGLQSIETIKGYREMNIIGECKLYKPKLLKRIISRLRLDKADKNS